MQPWTNLQCGHYERKQGIFLQAFIIENYYSRGLKYKAMIQSSTGNL